MPLVVKPFGDDHVAAVRQFNKRLEAGGKPWRFPESPIPTVLARRDSILPYYEFFLALENDTVRGGYVFKPQAFAFDGRVTTIGNNTFPVSEGTIDIRYAHVGLLVLKDALTRQPLLFGLGLGGYDEAISRLLRSAKWSMVSCPFYFKVNHPFRFLREIVFLRRQRSKRLMLDALAISGLGWMAIKSLQSLKALRRGTVGDVASEEVEHFSSWTDEIWRRAKDDYAMIAVRDAQTLNRIYPSSDLRFRRIRVRRGAEVIGWAILMSTQKTAHSHFGSMRVGSVVDCLAVPGEERHVVAMATRHLEREKADIIVTNQLHTAWCRAFPSNGYLHGPSNFILTVSPQLAERLHPFAVSASRIHVTRGDGDGPINL